MTAPKYADPAEQKIFDHAVTVLGEAEASRQLGEIQPSAMRAAVNLMLRSGVRQIVAWANTGKEASS